MAENIVDFGETGILPRIPGTVKYENHSSHGTRRLRFLFENGYAGSVIQGPYTDGGPQGLYEMAVMDHEGNILYDTPITEDVIGYLTAEDAAEVLSRIAALPAAD